MFGLFADALLTISNGEITVCDYLHGNTIYQKCGGSSSSADVPRIFEITVFRPVIIITLIIITSDVSFRLTHLVWVLRTPRNEKIGSALDCHTCQPGQSRTKAAK